MVFCGRAEGQGITALRNQLAGLRSDDMQSQNQVGLGVCQHLHKALSFSDSSGAAVGHEREDTDFVRLTSSSSVLPTQAISGSV